MRIIREALLDFTTVELEVIINDGRRIYLTETNSHNQANSSMNIDGITSIKNGRKKVDIDETTRAKLFQVGAEIRYDRGTYNALKRTATYNDEGDLFIENLPPKHIKSIQGMGGRDIAKWIKHRITIFKIR